MNDKCIWEFVNEYGYGPDYHYTGCKIEYSFEQIHPSDDYVNFCPNCGKKIEVKDA